ncbi:MAG: glycoside hydrolase family 9 protein, partial [Chitinispirillaceae bacterium]|nr:glycoside hydrolase family 9 protein [Chitinispirillaceae bacterium]
QCWSAATLAWAYYEYPTAFAPVKDKFFRMLKWFTDYFLACHPSAGVFYYGFGDGNADHGYWGAPEAQTGDRPARKAPPGSDVLAEGAAALALASLIFEDDAYAKKCLDAAKELYDLALDNAGSIETARMNDGAGGNFYKSSSHYDDMCWGAIWLYTATGESEYLDPIEAWSKIPNDPGDNQYQKKWSPAWDDVILFVLLKMAEITGKDSYYDGLVWNLEWCRDECNKSPAGMPVIDVWGVLRYASAEAGLGYTAYRLLGYDGFREKGDFIIDYCLSKNPENRSYLTGWGRNPPLHPHHRANEPVKGGATKGLIGALVGGPTDDSYADEIDNFQETEVAIDYNASFIFGLAGKIFFDNGGKAKNRAPSVAITSPLNGISVPEGETITIKVEASDGDGEVTKIELYEGDDLLESATESPLTYEWESSDVEEVTFTAVATDDSGKTSNPSKVTISFEGPCTEGEMLSRSGWVATASHSSSNAGEDPSGALDGDEATRWGSGEGQTEGMWFQLDMGFPREFDQIVLDANQSGNDFPRKYEVFVTDDPSDLGDAVASGEGAATTVIDLSETVKGQYIRIVSGESNGQWWSIHEIDVPCPGSEINTVSPHPLKKGAFKVDISADNKSVLFNYSLPEPGRLTIEEYSLGGSRLGTLVNGFRDAGNHVFKHDIKQGCSKTVIYKVNFNGHSLLKRATLIN